MWLHAILHGDCLDVMADMADGSVDAVVTDPPYGLEFMGKEWDRGVPGDAFWVEALRVAKPGAHLLAFGGTRTCHRLVCAIEDAGWEIRDQIAWIYGQGFPKSLDVSKAIDKAAGAEREVVGQRAVSRVLNAEQIKGGNYAVGLQARGGMIDVTAPSSTAAKQWDGWGTALKPAMEPIVLARKPLIGTVAENVLAHCTGGLNIDATRIPIGAEYDPALKQKRRVASALMSGLGGGGGAGAGHVQDTYNAKGRWPANVILDEEAGALLDEQSGTRKSGTRKSGTRKGLGFNGGAGDGGPAIEGSSGGASRFFYCSKASRKERGDGTTHPTVKPLDLMRYLVRLVTPPDGVVLDPFMGSGTTGIACKAEGFGFIGIEQELESYQTAKRRVTDHTL